MAASTFRDSKKNSFRHSFKNSFKNSFSNDSAYLDSAPLHLSGVSGVSGVEDFDMLFENDEESGAERMFSDSKASADLEALLANSRGSIGMMDFETLESSFGGMRFDSGPGAQEIETKRPSGGRRSQRRNRVSPTPLAQSMPPRFQISAVNFDPEEQQQQQQQQRLQRQQKPQAASCNDLHMSAPSFSALNDDSYTEALQNLADSMKRTEESRKHVIMQREMLTPEQQHALSSAKEHLNNQKIQVVPQQQHAVSSQQQPVTPPPPQYPTANPSLPRSMPSRASVMAAFLSGSRGTLTDGLENSRKQLGTYMSAMNQQTM
eukprot:CAMPEP_0183707482 /NCGR_PEP_ID=MMETSP0737-20130205/4043_1 /TAXON_ID=385413 /ORGANISM="Thalassiosira miniscula, Strain CCMP1093" /LENGTH=318 /DNA_ID=CAMNT_0025935153 /DNA_START=39 /DNA_END=995 /DNA_ORIENTATION=+